VLISEVSDGREEAPNTFEGRLRRLQFRGQPVFKATAFVLLNYLTDTVGLPAAQAGITLMIGRIWDAFCDPIIGYIPDRTVSKNGPPALHAGWRRPSFHNCDYNFYKSLQIIQSIEGQPGTSDFKII